MGAARPFGLAPHPDAELIRLCAEFDALQRAWLDVLHANPGAECGSLEEAVIEAAEDLARDAQAPLLDRILSLRAATLEGAHAIARSLALWDAELLKDGTGDTGQLLTTALARSLVEPEPIDRGEPGAGSLPMLTAPDAALLAWRLSSCLRHRAGGDQGSGRRSLQGRRDVAPLPRSLRLPPMVTGRQRRSAPAR